MQVAGIGGVDAPVEIIEVAWPRPLAGDEVLVEVRAAGVGNWDEAVRACGWDVGASPPTALGVEAAGTVIALGEEVSGWAPGDAVMTHPVPLPDQGTRAPRLIAPAGLLAAKPPGASWEAAAAFPVPLQDLAGARRGIAWPDARGGGTRLAGDGEPVRRAKW